MLGSAPLGSMQFGGSTEPYLSDYFEDISLFIPLETRDPQESIYLSKQIKAFKDNQNQNNDYAILALHQLFMFVYYGLLFSCLRRNEKVAQVVFTLASVRPEQKEQLLRISSLFTLSLINERTIFDLMSVVGCDTSSGLQQFKRLVNDRNDLAHCNGQTCVNFDSDINKYIDGLEEIHSKFAPVVGVHLLEINSIDFGATKDSKQDALRSILSNNYISQRMLELATPPTERGGLTKKANLLLIDYLS